MIRLINLLKEESFTAINKDSGKTTVFKSKSNRDAAIKAGTHDKKDGKDSKGGDVSDNPKADKPNMFSKDTGYDAGGKSKEEPKKTQGNLSKFIYGDDDDKIVAKPEGNPDLSKYSSADEDYFTKDSASISTIYNDKLTIDDLQNVFKAKGYGDVTDTTLDDIVDRYKDDEDMRARFKDNGISKGKLTKRIKDLKAQLKSGGTKSEPTKDDEILVIYKNKRGINKTKSFTDKKSAQKFADANDGELGKIVNGRLKSFPKTSVISKGEEPNVDEPKKDSTQQRAGNEQVNKVVRNKAKSLGVTPQKLGKEEYEKRMSQAAVEALTDANFHSESRALIAVLEDNPELAKNPSDDPNKPEDMMSDEYDEWKKGTAWGSSFGDSSDGTDDIAHSATGESSWDGQDSIDAIAFDLKMNGSHKLAAKIQSIFNEKNESSTSIADMIPESVVINEGTRSQVGVIGSNGKIISAYVHYDGYPSNMKPGLKHHMKSDKDVLKLIKMGGARGIFDDKEIEYYKNGTPLKGDSKDITGYIKSADIQNGAEFVYLYNIKDKKWYYADTYKDTKLKKLF